MAPTLRQARGVLTLVLRFSLSSGDPSLWQQLFFCPQASDLLHLRHLRQVLRGAGEVPCTSVLLPLTAIPRMH